MVRAAAELLLVFVVSEEVGLALLDSCVPDWATESSSLKTASVAEELASNGREVEEDSVSPNVGDDNIGAEVIDSEVFEDVIDTCDVDDDSVL